MISNAARGNAAGRGEILVIGNALAPCFQAALTALRREASVLTVGTMDESLRMLERGADPQWIVFAQTRRGGFRDDEVARLHAARPLATLFHLLGPWSEGELRTGAPLHGVNRVYWHDARVRLLRLWRGRNSATALTPRVFSALDRCLIEHASVARRGIPQRTEGVVVCAQSLDTFETLQHGLSTQGWRSHWGNAPKSEDPPMDAPIAWLIWDNVGWDYSVNGGSAVSSQADLRDAVARFSPRRTLLLHGWPRPEDAVAAQEDGVDTLLAKPYELNDLLDILESGATGMGRANR